MSGGELTMSRSLCDHAQFVSIPTLGQPDRDGEVEPWKSRVLLTASKCHRPPFDILSNRLSPSETCSLHVV